MLRLIFRITWRLALTVLAVVCIYLAAAFTLPYFKVNPSFQQCPGGVRIFVLSNGVHTDLVVPANTIYKNWQSSFPPEFFNASSPAYTYISFGWGDKGFYLETPTWDDLKFSTAFNAAFALSETAMHVAYLKIPDKNSPRCKELLVDSTTYKKLVSYVENSFKKNADGVIKIDAPGYGKHDLFYEAQGTYSLFKTCNCWTNTGLKQAGIKTACWSPFAEGLMRSLKE